MNMGSAVYATPVPAHGTLFLNNRNQLFALAVDGEVTASARTRPQHSGSRLARLHVLVVSSLASWLRPAVARASAGSPTGRSSAATRG